MTEETRTTPPEKENEALIQEMLRDAQAAPEPGSLKAGETVLHKSIQQGDETIQTPMTVRSISSAGYVEIWDSRTYEKYPVLYYMLPSKLRVRRADGSFRFTTNDPGKLPKRGSIKCMLHLEDPNRERYNELGFRACKKSNLTNPYQMKQHMRKKHPQEWEAIENERKDRERLEDRELQRFLLKSQMPKEEGNSGNTQEIQEKEEKVTKAPLYVSDKDKKKIS